MSEDLVPKPKVSEIVNEALIVLVERKGLTFGSYFTIEELKELAGPLGADDDRFHHYFLRGLTELLRERGYWFLSRGLNGQGYRVAQQSENVHYLDRCQRDAESALERGVVLGNATLGNPAELTQAEQMALEHELRATRHQLTMLRRSEDVEKVLRKHKPGLLKEPVVMDLPAEPPSPEA